MFCRQCGSELSHGAKFCTSCGAVVSDINGNHTCGAGTHPAQSAVDHSSINTPDQKSRKVKNLIMIAIGVIAGIVILLFLNDPINTVKNGTLNHYPDQTVGEAFEGFFSNPQWTSYRKDGDTYVKFTGGCTLYGERVYAKIVFLVDGNDFSIDSCRIGDMNITTVYEMESILDVIYE